MKTLWQRLRETRVLENYSFMTALSIFSALIGLVIYPYVIRMTGKDAYGTYVYAFTIATFFHVIMNFGFESPCAKAIVQAKDNLQEQCRIVSNVLTLKAGFILLCGIVFTAGLFLVPFMRSYQTLCVISFIHLTALSLFPTWYFQGLKKMKTVTYINVAIRLSTIPFILWLVHSPQDIERYAVIVMTSIVLGTIVAYICLFKRGIRLERVSMERHKKLLSDSLPFFATFLTDSLKSLSVKAIIKHTFGVGDVAIYDFAEKLVNIPRLFTQNINGALFPEVVNNATPYRVQRILKYERLIGAGSCVLIAILSYPAVLILGGREMMDAVSVTIILSALIYTWLVAGAYINFVFIPANRYYIITINQVIAFVSCVLIAIVGLFFWRNLNMVALSLILSGFIEILFCRYMSKRLPDSPLNHTTPTN